VHGAKRGRKRQRLQHQYLRKGYSIRQLALDSPLTVDAIYKRFGNNLQQLVTKKRVIRIRGAQLMVIIDALWQYFHGDLWTLYCIAIKANGSDKAIFLDPVLKPGKESACHWNAVLDELPTGINNRIIAVVSDGIRGIETIAENRQWIQQRCHFHLLSQLQKMRGKRSSTSGRIIREQIYATGAAALVEQSPRKLTRHCNRLNALSEDPLCPKAMKMIVRDFLRRLSAFRSYLAYPQLSLPTTVNVMESANSLIRRRVGTVNTPNAWQKWAIAIIRCKSIFFCK
jgi:hypothetical protein